MSDTQHIVESYFAHEELKNRIKNLERMALQPFITVARDPGSGGKPIAQAVAKRLKFKFYDDALIEEIAKSVKKRKKVIEEVDEKARGLIQELVHQLLNPEYISETAYINHLIKVTLGLAHQGKAVFVGRGANLFTPPAEGLHVLVTAPKWVRVKRAVEYENIDKPEAVERVTKITSERKKFVSTYFGKNYTNLNYYDLVINTRFFSIEAATDLVVAAYASKFKSNRVSKI